MYDDIASFYDLIHQEIKDDILFTIKLASRVGAPILELGCGTGRLILPLARTGHETTGLDNSAAMLDIARSHIQDEREEVQQRIRLIRGDMTSFQLEQRFDLIVIAHNTLMHLSQEQVKSCLDCVRHHLKPNGRLMIDVENPMITSDPSDDELLILERLMVDPTSDNNILQMSSSWVDQKAQIRHVTWIFDSSPRNVGSVNRTLVETKLHYFFAHQYEVIIDTIGLVLKDLYGDYDSTPYSEESPRLLMVIGHP